ncbi:MAG: prepilin peptidase [Lachnospiraceae bacterium]|nr:prepilin peptidase [Lachnospiraceae bacterium]
MNFSYLQWTILATVLVPAVITDIRERGVCSWLIVCGIIAGILNTAFNGMSSIWEYFLRFVPGIVILISAYLAKGCVGKGDGYMCIFLGSVLRTQYVLTALFFGFLFAAVTGIVLVVFKKISAKTMMPFIPFLALGVFVCGFL